MSVSKDPKRGTWKIYVRYTDWTGERKVYTKKGFKTKREALEHERDFLQSKSRDVNMNFETFVRNYMEELKPRIKYNTYLTKEHIIEKKILPYFGKRSLADIAVGDVVLWQNELLKMRDENDKPYSLTYLRTVYNQLNAIFNYAVRYYDLKSNPVKKAGSIGKAKAKEMEFWTKQEFQTFIEAMKSKPVSYYAFEILYWTGIREGELLALTKGDFDLKNRR